MRRQPGRSPEEGTSLSTAYARRRPVPGRRRGRGRRRGSLFAASAGSSAVPPPSSPPPSPPSSDGSRTSGTGGTANAPAGVHLSGLVSVGTGHLRLNNLNPRWTSRQAVSRLNESSPGSGATAVHFSNVSSVPSPRIKRDCSWRSFITWKNWNRELLLRLLAGSRETVFSLWGWNETFVTRLVDNAKLVCKRRRRAEPGNSLVNEILVPIVTEELR